MEVRLEGFDELKRKLDDLGGRAEALHGEHRVPFEELFPPSFMTEYTDFESIKAMLEASGFAVESTEDFQQIPNDQWDQYVASRTRFPDWETMLGTASQEWAKKQLGL